MWVFLRNAFHKFSLFYWAISLLNWQVWPEWELKLSQTFNVTPAVPCTQNSSPLPYTIQIHTKILSKTSSNIATYITTLYLWKCFSSFLIYVESSMWTWYRGNGVDLTLVSDVQIAFLTHFDLSSGQTSPCHEPLPGANFWPCV